MAAVWKERLDRLKEVIAEDVARGDYYGMVLKVGRGGEVVFVPQVTATRHDAVIKLLHGTCVRGDA